MQRKGTLAIFGLGWYQKGYTFLNEVGITTVWVCMSLGSLPVTLPTESPPREQCHVAVCDFSLHAVFFFAFEPFFCSLFSSPFFTFVLDEITFKHLPCFFNQSTDFSFSLVMRLSRSIKLVIRVVLNSCSASFPIMVEI